MPKKPPGMTIVFEPEEHAELKFNKPGPSGSMGGYQKMENFLIINTDLATGECHLDPKHFERLVRYMNNYGKGGPNARIRRACLRPLDRAGVHLEGA